MTLAAGRWQCPCGHCLTGSPDSKPFRCEEPGCVCSQCAGAHRIAFTVGVVTSYADLPPGTKKLGRHGPTDEDPSGYEGGIVFRTAESAASWISGIGISGYGVYRIALPVPWEECVDETGSYPAVLVDCYILGPA